MSAKSTDLGHSWKWAQSQVAPPRRRKLAENGRFVVERLWVHSTASHAAEPA